MCRQLQWQRLHCSSDRAAMKHGSTGKCARHRRCSDLQCWRLLISGTGVISFLGSFSVASIEAGGGLHFYSCFYSCFPNAYICLWAGWLGALHTPKRDDILRLVFMLFNSRKLEDASNWCPEFREKNMEKAFIKSNKELINSGHRTVWRFPIREKGKKYNEQKCCSTV